MKALTKASRINSAKQVLQHMNSGMTVVDACKEVGIPRSTYYHLINKHPEAMAEYQEMVEANARMQLSLILSSKTQILEKVSPPPDSVLITCGPPIMIKFTFVSATGLGFKPPDIVTTLEMKMKCGVGTCGRCNIGSRYVCRHGPVFTYEQMQDLPNEF